MSIPKWNKIKHSKKSLNNELEFPQKKQDEKLCRIKKKIRFKRYLVFRQTILEEAKPSSRKVYEG